MSHHFFNYTLGLPTLTQSEQYQFDEERSKLGDSSLPVAHLYLTRPLTRLPNPISSAEQGTGFTKLIVRQYDLLNNLLKTVEYHDVKVLRLTDGPDLIIEFRYSHSTQH